MDGPVLNQEEGRLYGPSSTRGLCQVWLLGYIAKQESLGIMLHFSNILQPIVQNMAISIIFS
jgi:hypothetical protein